MTISTCLMILALATGPGISQSVSNDSSTTSTSTKPPSEPEDNCYVNGIWTTPCPADSPWMPEPPPDLLPPT